MSGLLIFLHVELSLPCQKWRQGAFLHSVGGLKEKSGWFFFYPLCPTVGPCNNIQGVILSQQNHLTSRWQRQGERLHPPWCPLTPGTDPSGSAGLARRSRSVPAPRRTW